MALIISGGILPVTPRWCGAVLFKDEQHPWTVTSAAAIRKICKTLIDIYQKLYNINISWG